MITEWINRKKAIKTEINDHSFVWKIIYKVKIIRNSLKMVKNLKSFQLNIINKFFWKRSEEKKITGLVLNIALNIT